ncbi:MAG: hypothetical protein OEW15_09295 [Nitrospirota bacterium]|nr:hypothetical protein [Nitrospirota bacterium]
MNYCLASWSDWHNNIILDEVVQYIERCKAECEAGGRPFPLHKFIHHGLSSQAMAFNLLGPLITRNDYAPLVSLLSNKNVSMASRVVGAVFEYEDRDVFNEDVGQPTSLDIALKDRDEKPLIFIESKLVEQEFGGCSVFAAGDCDGSNPQNQLESCYLHFIGRKYWGLMNKYGFNNLLSNEKQCVFTSHYQFFREILFSLEQNGIFVLLHDERSPVFNYNVNGKFRGLMPYLLQYVPTQYRNRITSISIQELVAQIELLPRHKDWIDEFKVKFGLGELSIEQRP